MKFPAPISPDWRIGLAMASKLLDQLEQDPRKPVLCASFLFLLLGEHEGRMFPFVSAMQFSCVWSININNRSLGMCSVVELTKSMDM
ncbi:hypothetical protein BJX64DRAFT_54870 [Aspergillus heterothallicus]